MDNRMGSTKTKLIHLLSGEEEYLSGQWLADELQISRTAIWKNIRELEKQGFEFASVKKKGYKLLHSPEVVSPSEIQMNLSTTVLGRQLFFYDQVTSTQESIHKLASEGYPDGTVVLAGEQTDGRGRRKRKWSSAKGKGMWMSVLLRPPISPAVAPQLTVVAAVAMVHVLHEIGVEAEIKWPNDIMAGGRKVCGILTEMQAEQDWIDYVVLGIGLNVNQSPEDLPSELRQTATSLKMTRGTVYSIEDLASSFLNRLEKELTHFYESGFETFQETWQHHGFQVDEWMTISTWKERFRAKIRRIEADGALTVRMENGEDRKLYSAELLWNEDEKDRK